MNAKNLLTAKATIAPAMLGDYRLAEILGKAELNKQHDIPAMAMYTADVIALVEEVRALRVAAIKRRAAEPRSRIKRRKIKKK